MALVFKFNVTEANQTCKLPISGINIIISIDWGDGSLSSSIIEDHTYTSTGIYTVTITGTNINVIDCSSEQFSFFRNYLTECSSFGNVGLISLNNAFFNCINLTRIPDTLPPSVTTMDTIFKGAFNGSSDFIQSINWDITNVTSLLGMFQNTARFNSLVSFTYNVNDAVIKNMNNIFSGAQKFNQPFTLDITKVSTTAEMFSETVEFNSIVTFTTSNQLNSVPKDMSRMFFKAQKFNKPLLNFDTTKVITMDNMFNSYNQNVLAPFNQDISSWNVTSLETANGMLFNTSFSIDNYDKLLNGWSNQNVKSNVTFTNVGLVFSQAGLEGYNKLINSPNSWNINNDYLNIVSSTNHVYKNNNFNLTTLPLPQELISSLGNKTVYLTNSNITDPTVTPVVLSSAIIINNTLTFNSINLSTLGRTLLYVYIDNTTGRNINKLDLTLLNKKYLNNREGEEIFLYQPISLLFITVEEDPSPPPIVCFNKGTKILTNTGYVAIEQLKQGQLIKTLDKYVPIYKIGKKTITHIASPEKIENQLYVYKNSDYHEMTEDLIITGSHARLIDTKNENVTGKIQNKYKLPVYLDENSQVYDKKGEYTVYHIALDNSNRFGQYGIYANGLLVESCSIHCLQYRSAMKFIEKHIQLPLRLKK
jgi:hypothetical protein